MPVPPAYDYAPEKRAAYLSDQRDKATEMGMDFEDNMLLALQEKGKRGIKSNKRELVKPVITEIGEYPPVLIPSHSPVLLFIPLPCAHTCIPLPCALIHPTPLCSYLHPTPLCTVGMIMDGVETGLMDVFEALRHTTMLFMFRCVRPTNSPMGSGPTYNLEFDGDVRPFVSSKNLFVDFVHYLLARCIHLSYKAFEEVLTATGPWMENGMSCVLALAYIHMSLPCVLSEDFIAFFPAAFGIICENWFDEYQRLPAGHRRS